MLTARGEAKFRRWQEAIVHGSMDGASNAAEVINRAAAAIAPSPEEEAELLSAGEITGGKTSQGPGGGRRGIPGFGRFLRMAGMVPLKEAILEETPRVKLDGETAVASIGFAEQLNRKTGFFWNTKRRGIQGPTFPFNFAYVQALEYGGAIWVVTPRPGGHLLEPEPGLATPLMTKTLPPRRMYGTAADSARPAARAAALNRIRAAFRQAG